MLEKIWYKLNGSKTIVGTIALWVSAIMAQVVVGIWDYNPDWIQNAIKTLDWVGILFGGTGIGHKIYKKTNQ